MEKFIGISSKAKTDNSGEVVQNSKNVKLLKEQMAIIFGGDPENYSEYNFFLLSEISRYIVGELKKVGGIATG